MAWQMLDDLTGDVIPDIDLAGRVTVCIDNAEVHAIDHVGPRPNLRSLLAELGAHLEHTFSLDGPAATCPAAEQDPPAPDPVETGWAPGAFLAPVADAVDPAELDRHPADGPEQEPDWRTRAEELLEAGWSPERISAELGIEPATVKRRRNGRSRT